MSYSNPSTPMDYTNNDFRAIFPELLDLVKKLTSKWDPTISNESDPGVILLKLNAIVADKNNYNIDKNILEAFPETLTQDISARSVYRQLGYNMRWYVASETTVVFKYVGSLNDLPDTGWSLRIPAFTTMVTDEDATIVYTLLEDVIFTKDSLIASASAIEGVYKNIKVGGTTKLSYSNLDEKNRIYFDEYNVPQNGIFVTSEQNGVSHNWSRVENLANVAAYDSQYYYEFGIDPQTNICYIEFPQNAADLIGESFSVGYVATSGSEGRVQANQLVTFYSDTKVYMTENPLLPETQEALDTNVLVVTNPSASTVGLDPETIPEAAKNYRKVLGTFDTLVTVRDYMNAIYNSGIVSNAQVSDRYSDLQSSFTVVVPTADGYATQRYVQKHIPEGSTEEEEEEDEMNAYELKLLLLGNNGQVYSADTYDTSFNVEVGNNKKQEVINYLDNSKAISHDYADFKTNVPVMFRNLYSLRIRYIPKTRLDANKVAEVGRNITTVLRDQLNARNVDFGQAIDYNTLQSWIKGADSRIQTVILEDPTYTTYATYFTEVGGITQVRSIPVSDYSNDPFVIEYPATQGLTPPTSDFSNLKDKGKYIFVNSIDHTMYKYQADSYMVYADSGLVDYFRRLVIARNVFAGVTPPFIKDSGFTYALNKKVLSEIPSVDRITTNLNITLSGVNPDNPIYTRYTLRENESVRILGPQIVEQTNYSTSTKFALKLNTERGTGPNAPSNKFIGSTSESLDWSMYRANLSNGTSNARVYMSAEGYELDTETTWSDSTIIGAILIPYPETSENYGNKYKVTFTSIKTADGLPFYDITGWVDSAYGNWTPNSTLSDPAEAFLNLWEAHQVHIVKIQDVISIPAGTSYQLQDGEYIVFLVQQEDGEFAPYTYFMYRGTNDSKSPILKPTFDIRVPEDPPSAISSHPFVGETGRIPYGSALYNYIDESMFGPYDLSGVKSISMCRVAQASYTDGFFYFITNKIEEASNGNGEVYVLSLAAETEGGPPRYILESEEYFLHVSSDKRSYEVLGPGTLIEFSSSDVSKITVTRIPYTQVLNNGLEAFLNYVVPVKNYAGGIYVRQQQINNFTQGDTLTWTKTATDLNNDGNFEDNGNLELNSSNYTTIDPIGSLQYTLGSSNETGTLGALELNDDTLTWVGKSILNISSSSYTPQTISHYHGNGASVSSSMKFYFEGTELQETAIEVNLEYPGPITIATSYPVEKVGGSLIEVAYTSVVDGSSIPISVQTFTTTNETAIPWDITIEEDPEESTYSYGENRFKVPSSGARSSGGYIIEFEAEVTNVEPDTLVTITGSVKNDNNDYTLPIQGDLLGNQAAYDYQYLLPHGKSKLYLLYVVKNPNASSSSLTLQVNSILDNGIPKPATIKLTPSTFHYFEPNSALALLSYNSSVLDCVKMLHQTLPEAVNLYKWNYQPEDSYILDPLSAASFFDTQHVFNKYCIPQLRSTFGAVNINDSLIQIVNNK